MNEMTDTAPEHLASPSTATKKARRKISVVKIFFLFVFFALIAGIAVTGYLYYQARQKLMFLSTPQGQQQLSAKEIEAVQAQLSKLTLLPEESPVVATITDAGYLASQSAFYQQSQNGDKVVVYPVAQKAFIFSPSRNIIVNSGPLINQNADQTLNIEVRNGSTTPGLGDKVKTDLEAQGAVVTKVTNASRKTYGQTIVVGLTEKAQGSVVQSVATFLKGDVVTQLPTAEASSTADVVVILGESAAPTSQNPTQSSPNTAVQPSPQSSPQAASSSPAP